MIEDYYSKNVFHWICDELLWHPTGLHKKYDSDQNRRLRLTKFLLPQVTMILVLAFIIKARMMKSLSLEVEMFYLNTIEKANICLILFYKRHGLMPMILLYDC